MAPHVTAQALKVAVYCGGVFKELGFDICPSVDALRGDIIQAVKFNDKDLLVAFCQGIQKYLIYAFSFSSFCIFIITVFYIMLKVKKDFL